MDFNLLQLFLIGVSLISACWAFVLIAIDFYHPKIDKHLPETDLTQGNTLKNIKETGELLEANMGRVLHKIAATDIHSMKTSTKTFEKSYALELETLNQELHKITTNAIQNTQKTYTDKLTVFLDELIKTGLSTQSIVDKKTAELLTLSDMELDEYKKQKMEKIDQEIKEKIDKINREVLKNGIPENLQNELIMKSLEQAKNDEMFKL